MFEPESKDIIFKILIRIFALIYMIGATVFLLRVKPVMEISVSFLCVSLWVFAAMFYFAGSKQWSLHSMNSTLDNDHTTKKDYSFKDIAFGFFYVCGSFMVWVTANTEIFFLVVIAGYLFYMTVMYLSAYLLTRIIRYFFHKKSV